MVLNDSITKLPLIVLAVVVESDNIRVNRPTHLMVGMPKCAQTSLIIDATFYSYSVTTIFPCRQPPGSFALSDTFDRLGASR